MLNKLLTLFWGFGRPTPIDHLLSPVQRFIHRQTSGGIVLLIAAIAAMILVNSPLEPLYKEVDMSHFVIGIAEYSIDKPIHFWISDALMAVFFFVVGLEIKRSLLLGELASVRSAALPIVAAVGGMVVPAALYLLLNSSGEAARGWGVPMSTDIAFSLGVLALLGTRAPLSLKVFLTAFAIVDDIGAIAVIAVFFTETIHWSYIWLTLGLLGVLVVMNIIGIRNILPYVFISIAIWVAIFNSGVHATVAGVLVAMAIPLQVRINPGQFVARMRRLVDMFELEDEFQTQRGPLALTTEHQRGVLVEVRDASNQVESPLQRLEYILHPWVAFVIMPLFALANAHVPISGELMMGTASPVAIGVILGLVVGKPLGIMGFCWVAVKLGVASLPLGVSWRHIFGVTMLGGIGFTMSIFITGLAFTDPELILQSKIGILIASLVAGTVGYLVLRMNPKQV